MKNIFFIILPFRSHFYPMISLGKEWQKKGYTVYFSSLPAFDPVIKAEGFEPLHLPVSDEIIISTLKGFIGLWLSNLLKPQENYYCNFLTALEKQAHWVIDELKPEKIYLSANLPEYSAVLHQSLDKMEMVGIYLSTLKTKGIPPLTSSYIPNENWWSKVYCEFLWQKYFFIDWLKGLIKTIALNGQTEINGLKAFCRARNIEFKSLLNTNHTFHLGVNTIPYQIISNQALEYRNYCQPELIRFTGLKRERDEGGQINTPQYQELKQYLQKKIKVGSKIIYMAFGTWYSSSQNLKRDFISRVFNVVMKHQQLELVYSGVQLESNSDRIHYFSFAPQLDILRYAHLMISHAGLGSVNECFERGVPILAIPLNQQLDQPGNAARIVANSWGERINLKSSEETISRKIHHLIQ